MEAGARARDAEARGDDARTGAEWRRYRLIRDRDLVDLADLESAHGDLPDSRTFGA